MFRRVVLPALTVALATSGCVNELTPSDPPLDVGKTDAQKAEAWSPQDAPSMFSADLDHTFAALPTQGEAARIPWAGSYWPVYEDGINHVWKAGEESPAAKYGRAFNRTGVGDAVSRANGIDGQSGRTACTAANAATTCKSDLGEACAIRPGKTEGRCIPTWFGICHAWAPAAIMVPEPEREVTRNGVTFRVNDLKALASLVHEGVEHRFVSLRCELDDRAGADNDVEFDAHGRPNTSACRDSNAGSFHVLLANYLGVKRASFVFDRTFDDEVWNQPLRGYRVLESRAVTVAEAHRLIGVAASGGTSTSHDVTVAAGAWHHLAPVVVTPGTPLKVTMQGSGDGDLFVQFGAQPSTSAYACRPYADGSDETCELVVPAGASEAFVSVNGYTAATVNLRVDVGGATPDRYAFNDKAKSLQYVKIDVQFIGESDSATDGNLTRQIDRYTHTDRYEYVLELDDAGKIIGGEWVGASKRFHPDFAWLPIRVARTSAAGGTIRYADVKSLLDESVASAPGPTPTPQTETHTFVVAKNAWRQFGPFTVAAGGTLSARLSGSGDADLYVKAGQAPTASTWDCRPYKDGSGEDCSVVASGPVFVAVGGYAASSDVALTITWTGPAGPGGGAVTPPPPPPPPPPATTHLDVSGDVAQGAYAYHTVQVVAGTPIVIRTTAAKDIDVYVQMGRNPTESDALAQAYTMSGNETLRVVPASSGTLHIGVHGYQASPYRLTTAAQ